MTNGIASIKHEIAALKDQCVDVIYHPHSSYRMVTHGKAKITQLYDNFFEICIDTKEYGSYKTTISYIDVYTHACIIQPHIEEKKPASSL